MGVQYKFEYEYDSMIGTVWARLPGLLHKWTKLATSAFSSKKEAQAWADDYIRKRAERGRRDVHYYTEHGIEDVAGGW